MAESDKLIYLVHYTLCREGSCIGAVINACMVSLFAATYFNVQHRCETR